MRGITRSLLAQLALVCAATFVYQGVWLPLHATSYDFTGPYEAAYALAHHVVFPLYDVTAQRAFNHATLHLPDGPSDFRWTPPAAALLIPLGLLPYWPARLIWWALGMTALLAALWLLARCVEAATAGRMTRWPAFAALLGAASLMQPVMDSLRLGQSTTILLLGLALIAYGEVVDRQALAGIGLAIMTLDKLYPAALLLFFLWRGRYRLCAWAVSVITLVCALTLPLTGVGMYGDFARALLTFSNEANGGPVNLSLYHALIVSAAALAQPGRPEPRGGALAAGAALVCAALFAIALWAKGRRDERATPGVRLFQVSWAATALLALTPIVWGYYYLLALVPAAWLLTRPDRERAAFGRLPEWGWLALAAASVALATLPLPLDTRAATPMGALYVVGILARPLGLAGLWLAHALYAISPQAGHCQASALEPTAEPA